MRHNAEGYFYKIDGMFLNAGRYTLRDAEKYVKKALDRYNEYHNTNHHSLEIYTIKISTYSRIETYIKTITV